MVKVVVVKVVVLMVVVVFGKVVSIWKCIGIVLDRVGKLGMIVEKVECVGQRNHLGASS